MPNKKNMETLMIIKDGKPKYDREGLSKAISTLSDGYYWISITKKHRGRSGKENAYYWGVVVESMRLILSDCNGEEVDSDYAHEILKLKCNPEKIAIGATWHTLGGSTAKMTTVQFEDYLARCREWILETFDITISLPNE